MMMTMAVTMTVEVVLAVMLVRTEISGRQG